MLSDLQGVGPIIDALIKLRNNERSGEIRIALDAAVSHLNTAIAKSCDRTNAEDARQKRVSALIATPGVANRMRRH